MGRMQGREVGPLLFGLLCSRSTAAYFASHSWQQSLSSCGIMWDGEEQQGIGPPALGERRHEGCGWLGALGVTGSKYRWLFVLLLL